MAENRLSLEIQPQPDDSTCGPTCLQAIYRHFGDEVPLARLISEVTTVDTGGTLAVHLATHALRRGYDATIYTYNLHLFDPTWFRSGVDLTDRLRAQAARKQDRKLQAATEAYLEFLRLGGQVRFQELTRERLAAFLDAGQPILTGLSASYLYGESRETADGQADDAGGFPVGHFVVLYGWNPEGAAVSVADPYPEAPELAAPYYEVGVDRLICAILLGVITYDANLLILRPSGREQEQP